MFIDGSNIFHAQKKLGWFVDWQYATLFYKKTEKYFKKTNRIMLGNGIITKVIRMTANNLNQKEQIVLNKSVLLSCELVREYMGKKYYFCCSHCPSEFDKNPDAYASHE